ncbi:MAG: FUSC family protein, partial [Desulfuromonadales bacterium]
MTTRTQNAIKPALAVVIAYGISLAMGWENPYWAGFAVAMISLSTAGQSLNKGAMRMLGTLVAAAAALISIAWFAQDRWWFIGTLSVYIGFCTYMITGKKRQYFWYCCAFVCLVICVHAAGDATNAFEVAVLRVQQTGM